MPFAVLSLFDQLNGVAIHILNGLVAIDVKATLQPKPLLPQSRDRVFNACSHHPAHVMQFDVAGRGTSAQNDEKQVRGGAHRFMLMRSVMLLKSATG